MSMGPLPDVEGLFRARALLSAPLVALVGQRVAMNAAPPGSEMPLVAYTVRHDPQYTFTDLVCDDATIDAQCWATSSAAANAVAAALSAAVMHAEAATACTEIARNAAYDPEVDLHACIVTYQWLT